MAILFMLLATYFNSRPCVRGDGKKMTAKKVYITFQFTPLREGRLTVMEAIFLGRVFQFTPLREGRLLNDGGNNAAKHFNSRPCVRGDL